MTPEDAKVIKWAAATLPDTRLSDVIPPDGYSPVTVYWALERAGAPGLPAPNDKITLEGIHMLGWTAKSLVDSYNL